MKFVVVNGRSPRLQSICTRCREQIGDSYPARHRNTAVLLQSQVFTPATARGQSRQFDFRRGRRDVVEAQSVGFACRAL